VEITKDESRQTMSIAGALEIGSAEELRDNLRDFLDRTPCPILDLSRVGGVDAAALQVLCAARKTAERSGKVFQIAAVSAAITNKSEALGLSLADLGAASAGRGEADGI
jgi:anti-anti-sigma factor